MTQVSPERHPRSAARDRQAARDASMTSATTSVPEPATQSVAGRIVRRHPRASLFALLGGALLFRLAFDAVRQIVPDEGVYWSWSRHLAAGYLDHPPMVAVLIRLSTSVLGQNELGVRFFNGVLSIGSVGVIAWLADRLLRDPVATVWCAAILVTAPLVVVLGTIVTPDTPSIFFSVCGVGCAARSGRSHSAIAPRGHGRTLAPVRRVHRTGDALQVHDRPASGRGGDRPSF